MNIIQQLASCKVVDFPSECWESLIGKIKEGGFQALLVDKLETLVCLFKLAAYFLCRLRGDDKPIIGATYGTEEHLLDGYNLLCAEVDYTQPLNEPMGSLKSALIERMLIMIVSYLISVAQDTDQVKELIEKVTAWLREYMGA